MAYKRTFNRRRITRRKTPWYSKKYNAQQLALKAWKGVKYIRGLVNSEMLHNTKTYSVSVPGTGSMNHLTAVSQDDTSTGRTGNSILLRQLAYRFKIEINSAVTSNTTFVMMIVQDTQQVGDTSPSITDVLSSANTFSLMALGTAGRFKVLKRQQFILTPASGGRPAVESKGFLKLYSHVRYNGSADSDIQKNGLYLLMLSSEGTNYPTFSGSFRIGYHDN